jgi:hypothetical protein
MQEEHEAKREENESFGPLADFELLAEMRDKLFVLFEQFQEFEQPQESHYLVHFSESGDPDEGLRAIVLEPEHGVEGDDGHDVDEEPSFDVVLKNLLMAEHLPFRK